MDVTRSGECGNSPKNAFVEDFIVALVRGENPGDKLEKGTVLPSVGLEKASAVTILHAISHGRVGAGNGEAIIDGKTQRFAIVLEFANTKGERVKRIDFYRGG